MEKKVHELGGTTVMSKTPEGKNAWFVNVKDPEGNRFGMYECNWDKMKKEC
jgi:predicted enzyme related to lactoylglutathione lyase